MRRVTMTHYMWAALWLLCTLASLARFSLGAPAPMEQSSPFTSDLPAEVSPEVLKEIEDAFRKGGTLKNILLALQSLGGEVDLRELSKALVTYVLSAAERGQRVSGLLENGQLPTSLQEEIMLAASRGENPQMGDFIDVGDGVFEDVEVTAAPRTTRAERQTSVTAASTTGGAVLPTIPATPIGLRESDATAATLRWLDASKRTESVTSTPMPEEVDEGVPVTGLPMSPSHGGPVASETDEIQQEQSPTEDDGLGSVPSAAGVDGEVTTPEASAETEAEPSLSELEGLTPRPDDNIGVAAIQPAVAPEGLGNPDTKDSETFEGEDKEAAVAAETTTESSDDYDDMPRYVDDFGQVPYGQDEANYYEAIPYRPSARSTATTVIPSDESRGEDAESESVENGSRAAEQESASPTVSSQFIDDVTPVVPTAATSYVNPDNNEDVPTERPEEAVPESNQSEIGVPSGSGSAESDQETTLTSVTGESGDEGSNEPQTSFPGSTPELPEAPSMPVTDAPRSVAFKTTTTYVPVILTRVQADDDSSVTTPSVTLTRVESDESTATLPPVTLTRVEVDNEGTATTPPVTLTRVQPNDLESNDDSAATMPPVTLTRIEVDDDSRATAPTVTLTRVELDDDNTVTTSPVTLTRVVPDDEGTATLPPVTLTRVQPNDDSAATSPPIILTRVKTDSSPEGAESSGAVPSTNDSSMVVADDGFIPVITATTGTDTAVASDSDPDSMQATLGKPTFVRQQTNSLQDDAFIPADTATSSVITSDSASDTMTVTLGDPTFIRAEPDFAQPDAMNNAQETLDGISKFQAPLRFLLINRLGKEFAQLTNVFRRPNLTDPLPDISTIVSEALSSVRVQDLRTPTKRDASEGRDALQLSVNGVRVDVNVTRRPEFVQNGPTIVNHVSVDRRKMYVQLHLHFRNVSIPLNFSVSADLFPPFFSIRRPSGEAHVDVDDILVPLRIPFKLFFQKNEGEAAATGVLVPEDFITHGASMLNVSTHFEHCGERDFMENEVLRFDEHLKSRLELWLSREPLTSLTESLRAHLQVASRQTATMGLTHGNIGDVRISNNPQSWDEPDVTASLGPSTERPSYSYNGPEETMFGFGD